MDLSTSTTISTGEDPPGAGGGDADKSSTPSDGGTPECQPPKTTDDPMPPKAPEDASSSGERGEEREVRKLTLETLLREGVLESGDGVLSMEYMGMRFTGDLLPDGSIRWGESGEVFPSPSAWAIHCKRITQPDKKTSCGWSQVKYKGRKLELYKQEWLHRHKAGRPSNTTSVTANASLINPLTMAAAAATSGTTVPVPTSATGLISVAGSSATAMVGSVLPVTNIRTNEPAVTSASAATSSTTITPTTAISTAAAVAPPSDSTVVTTAPTTSGSTQESIAATQGTNTITPATAPAVAAGATDEAAANDQTKPAEEETKAFETMIRVGKTVIRKPRWFVEAKRRALGLPGEGQDDNKENGSGQSGQDGDCNGSALDKLPVNPQYDPVTFASIERLQPFHISVSSNVLLLVDFHCHLSRTEVCGYLGGTWDVATHAMQITQAFPVKVPLDSTDHVKVMEEIQLSMCSRSLYPVGWYHSHPRLSPHPTKRDVLKQLDYQLDMRGDNEAQYMPVIGLICSPQGAMESLTEAELMLYWVMPPPENRPHEVGKAMKMVYAHNQDSFLTQDLLMEMRLLAEHYRNGNRLADFTAPTASSPSHTVWDQLKTSLSTKLPRDLQTTSNANGQNGAGGGSQDTAAQAVQHFWEFVRGLIIPNSALQQQQQIQQQQQQQVQQQQLIHQHHPVHAQPGTSKT